VLAWNRAATVVLTDYSSLPADQRNLLRQMFLNPQARAVQVDWRDTAHHMVSVFRSEIMRAGASRVAQQFVEMLAAESPEFAAMWHGREVGGSGEGVKLLNHPKFGRLQLEYSSFTVASRSDLSLVVYNPVNPEDAGRIGALLEQLV
jgi:hypothetical protein